MRASAFVIALYAVLFAGAPAAATPMSVAAFRDRMAAAWNERFDTKAMPVGDTAFDAKLPDGTSARVNVDNAFAEYLKAPADIDAVIAVYLNTLTEAWGTAAAKLDQLVVIVRPTNYLTKETAPGADLSNFLPPRQLAGDLSLFLAVDSPSAIRTAATIDLENWHIDLATAWERGLANIKPRVGALQMIRIGDENGASGIGSESGLAPSLLATPATCGPEKPDGINAQVVLVVSRDAFLFGVPEDPDSMKRFWRSAKAVIQRNATLSSTPITCRQGTWVTVPMP